MRCSSNASEIKCERKKGPNLETYCVMMTLRQTNHSDRRFQTLAPAGVLPLSLYVWPLNHAVSLWEMERRILCKLKTFKFLVNFSSLR